MKKIAILTDSNSGITQKEAKELGIFVLPMPFSINGTTFFEDIDLSQEEFYLKLEDGADISTSMAAIGSLTDLWDDILKTYDEIIHIPMSSELSSSCETAMMCANDYDNRVFVVNNQRISVTQKRAAIDAKEMSETGMSAKEIKEFLEETKLESSIYVTLDTLYYLKKGGRITNAAAAIGTLLKIKPVLQIQGGKLDAFAKARTMKQAKSIMINALLDDFEKRYQNKSGDKMWISVAYTKDRDVAMEFKNELLEIFPEHEIIVDPLSLSVACHIGPGALAAAWTKKRN